MPRKRALERPSIESKSEAEYGELYAEHRLRLYEIYEKTVHGISDRRQIANSFYLTICTAIVGYEVQFGQNALLVVAGIAICALWLRAIGSYRDINSAKFKVIHAMESALPLRPYTAEWALLDEGKNPHVYRPFASIEVVVPWIFAILMMVALLVDQQVWQQAKAFAQAIGLHWFTMP